MGRGKPKFMSDRKGFQMAAKTYPNLTIEDWRDYAVMGCTVCCLPNITMHHAWEGICITPKILELVLHNGKCSICGRQIGPLTGDPRTFVSMDRSPTGIFKAAILLDGVPGQRDKDGQG